MNRRASLKALLGLAACQLVVTPVYAGLAGPALAVTGYRFAFNSILEEVIQKMMKDEKLMAAFVEDMRCAVARVVAEKRANGAP